MKTQWPQIIKSITIPAALLLASVPLLLPGVLAQDSQLARPLPTLADVVEQTVPAVVSISVRSSASAENNPLYNDPFFRRFFGNVQPPPQLRMSAGSGVIVDAERGYIITNYHVVADGQEISVALADGRTLNAELVGSDKATDIALLRVEAENLTQIEIRDSAELRVGDYVVAIGNPFGLGQTVTSGIVSALGRSGLDIEGYEDFIQTDASINPGNSGGALVSLDGRLVGINTAILAPTGGNVGIGFAIPSNMATAVMAQLVAYGEVRRGQLGVSIQDLTPDLAEALGMDQAGGALVTTVVPQSAADLVGIQSGDIIVAIDDRPVSSGTDVRNRIGLMPIGTKVRLTIMRDAQEMDVTATIALGSVASNPTHPLPAALQGAQLRDLRPGEGNGQSGVLVQDVAAGSPAAAAGLIAGDLILAVNQQAVASVDGLIATLSITTGTLVLELVRDGQPLLLIIR